MSKTTLTREIELNFLLKLHLDGERAINECTLGRHGIVDIISYSSKNVYEIKPGNKNRTRTRPPVWKCYEIKTSKADFHSPSKWTFVGHYNYFVIPEKLFRTIEKDVPKGVGVITYNEEHKYFTSKVRATKAKPLMRDDDLISEVMSSMSRELSRSVYGERGINSINNLELEIEVIRRLKSGKLGKSFQDKLLRAIRKLK